MLKITPESLKISSSNGLSILESLGDDPRYIDETRLARFFALLI